MNDWTPARKSSWARSSGMGKDGRRLSAVSAFVPRRTFKRLSPLSRGDIQFGLMLWSAFRMDGIDQRYRFSHPGLHGDMRFGLVLGSGVVGVPSSSASAFNSSLISAASAINASPNFSILWALSCCLSALAR